MASQAEHVTPPLGPDSSGFHELQAEGFSIHTPRDLARVSCMASLLGSAAGSGKSGQCAGMAHTKSYFEEKISFFSFSFLSSDNRSICISMHLKSSNLHVYLY